MVHIQRFKTIGIEGRKVGKEIYYFDKKGNLLMIENPKSRTITYIKEKVKFPSKRYFWLQGRHIGLW